MGVISSSNHWWQNWGKTHAYVAERMFFPRRPDEIVSAIVAAESAQRPVRAVGGGWSFSDASLPGKVTTNRPGVDNLEAIAEVLPHVQGFDPSPNAPSIASVKSPSPAPDGPGTMIMVEVVPDPGHPIGLWNYEGAGVWTYGSWRYEANEQDFLSYLGARGVRPARTPGALRVDQSDVAGSLVMFDMSQLPLRASRDWFYNGNGVWSVGVAGDSEFARGDLPSLHGEGRLQGSGKILRPRAAGAGEALALLLSRSGDTPKGPEPVYVINTRSFTSSLQQDLPAILSASAKAATARHLFHVEAGITIAELGELLAHQSPRLSLQAISGSPGASLAGALASATHGAEFNWPLLVDTVKAVHLIGPGGLQWWIEGDESVADPAKLRAAYPDIALERIIRGTEPVAGIRPQDWLNAAIVSLGSIGVLYSVVLQVVEQFGVREVVTQTKWRSIGSDLSAVPIGDPNLQMVDFETKLRLPATTKVASSALLEYLLDGSMNGTGIPARDAQMKPVNRYADLAINPNRRPDGDYDCWIGNREQTWRVPIDPNPPAGNEMAAMLAGVIQAFDTPGFGDKLAEINGLSFPDAFGTVLGRSTLKTKLGVLASAADAIDVGLDLALTPTLNHPKGPAVAHGLLTGVLAGLLGTANLDKFSDKTGVSVGALGFPGSGVMGTGLEIALSPADAFGFLQTEILDRLAPVDPFLGYVSIRVCSRTETLMGMEQFGDSAQPYSVMIEVVAFATDNCRAFMHELQARTLARIQGGLDAMLHWGLENHLLTGGHLRNTKALKKPSGSGPPKLDTFKAVRGLLQAASPSTYRAFDNGFTERLWLDAKIVDDDPYTFPTMLKHAQKSVIIGARNYGYGSMRTIGASVDGDFRTAAANGAPPNLIIGALPPTATPKGDFFELPVTFVAHESGPHHGVLTIVTQGDIADSVRIIRVGLHVHVEAFEVSLVNPLPPAVLDFGSVALGNYATKVVSVQSNSTMAAWLDSYDLSTANAISDVGIVTQFVGPVGPGQPSGYSVVFEPTHVGPLDADLTLFFSEGGATPRYSQQLKLRVTGVGIGVQAELSPASLDFGSVGIGSESAPKTITLSNVGQLPLILSGTLIGSDFRLTGPRPATIGPGGHAEMDVVFRPGLGGFRSSAFSISSNSARPPLPVELEGIGLVEALLESDPTELTFGSTPVGSRNDARLTVTNAGAVPIALATVNVVGPDAGEFSVLGASLAAGSVMGPEGTCEIRIGFEPTSVGRKDAILEVAHDGATSPFHVGLGGRAIVPLTLVPSLTELDFGSVKVGSTSARQEVAMANSSAYPVTINDVAIAGPNATEFVLDRLATPDVLAPGTTRGIGVTAQPAAMGPRLADLTVDVGGPPIVVALRAVGLEISVRWSDALIDFDKCKVGSTAPRRETFVVNTGNEPLVMSLIDTTGDFTMRDLTDIYMTLAPNGGDKSFWLWFKPTAAGQLDGSLNLHVSGSGSVLSLPMTGVGF